jgi:hypothetical protein
MQLEEKEREEEEEEGGLTFILGVCQPPESGMCSGTGGKGEGYGKEEMSKREGEVMKERERMVKD